ncbi:acyl-CoA synthetase (AMP-forming)/AMP-acid ligase II [Streptacidiphilus sp. MAP12-33]|uniref:fatty acyl-AMP ligase n=1 Tax=Streptacidiphilus sp. MAP12-33 TaxID=3156266 RepID=UPI00351459CE
MTLPSNENFPTFTDLVRHRVAEHPERDAYIFLHDSSDNQEPEHLTYAGLDLEARRLGSWLQGRELFGERVLMLYNHGLAFSKAFAGCLYAGAVAVPSPLPGGHGQAFSRVTGIVRDAGVRVVLTDRANVDDVTDWLEAEGLSEEVECLATDTPDYGDADAWTPPPLGPEDLAFLQYTSGSTSDPKGVMVSHRNLLANEECLVEILGTTPGGTLGSWLPYFHDMGLIGFILQAPYQGSTLVQMSPVSFLKRPHRWLEMISEYRVEVCGGPNFAYDLCTRRITDAQLAGLDLSCWKSALNGAEPIRAASIHAFAERFAAVGFDRGALHPGYGMAETTLGVTGSVRGVEPIVRAASAAELENNRLADAAEGESSRSVVSCGRVVGFDLRIVDPESHEELPEGGVGEIWVRGESVARGYWNRDEVNRETFGAHTTSGAGPFLRTGDLGALLEGELYVTGRRKEVLIFQGRNVYPQDVEQVVQGFNPLLGQGPGSVFTVPVGGREVAVVVQEIRNAGPDTDLESLAQSVQWGVSREFDVPVGGVLLAKPGTVRKTTSGKIQRSLMQKLFLDGKLEGIQEVLSPEVAARIGRPVPVGAPA